MHPPTKKPVGRAITAELYSRTAKNVQTINTYVADWYLSEDEIIERGLLLAADDPSLEDIDRLLQYYSGHMMDSDLAPDTLYVAEEWHRVWWDREAVNRAAFKSRLEKLIRSPDRYRKAFQQSDLNILRKDMLVISELSESGKVKNRFFPRSVKAAYTYVLTRLSAEEHKRWKQLTKCLHCGRTFYRRKSGGRPRKYCSDVCSKEADAKMALERQKAPDQRKKQRERRRR